MLHVAEASRNNRQASLEDVGATSGQLSARASQHLQHMTAIVCLAKHCSPARRLPTGGMNSINLFDGKAATMRAFCTDGRHVASE